VGSGQQPPPPSGSSSAPEQQQRACSCKASSPIRQSFCHFMISLPWRILDQQ
jgi:hypothetical protein